MEQLISMARNIRINVTDEGLEPEIEVVLTTMEKEHEFRGTGLVPVETVRTHRLATNVAGLEKLKDGIEDWIADAEKVANRVTVKPNE